MGRRSLRPAFHQEAKRQRGCDVPMRGRESTIDSKPDPETGVAPGFTRCRNMRSRCRCSMCPAIHINSRSWLRSSSTHEPSDPPLRVVSHRQSSDEFVPAAERQRKQERGSKATHPFNRENSQEKKEQIAIQGGQSSSRQGGISRTACEDQLFKPLRRCFPSSPERSPRAH